MVSISELYTDLMELINQRFHTKEEIETLLSDATSDLSTVATTGSYTDLTDKPTIPSPSNTTPSSDTLNGDVGNGVTWARSNHKHPKSDLYAEFNHNHTLSNLSDVETVDVVVTYNDNSTETLSIITKFKPSLVIIIDSDDNKFSGVNPSKCSLIEDNQIISEVDYDSSEYQFIFNNVPYGEYRCMIRVQYPGGTGYGYTSIIYDANHYEYHSNDLTITYGG